MENSQLSKISSRSRNISLKRIFAILSRYIMIISVKKINSKGGKKE